MQIKQLAQLHNISPAAIRHYEHLGLLDATHVQRLPNGYRDFTEAASRRIWLIKLGQSVGFSLDQMRTDLRCWDDGGISLFEKKAILRKQLESIEANIAQLQSTRDSLLREIEKECTI
jgi:DNA-binding transcriptional MerR regulator